MITILFEGILQLWDGTFDGDDVKCVLIPREAFHYPPLGTLWWYSKWSGEERRDGLVTMGSGGG